MKENYGYIYKITNKKDKKFYIGKHKAIKFDPNYFGSGIHISRAIKKYGKNNFSIKILEWCITLDQLNIAEKKWINKLDAKNPKKAYNIANGGDGGKTYDYNSLPKKKKQELHKKFSETAKRNWKLGYSKVHKPTKEELERRSQNMKGKNVGKKRSKKTKKLLSFYAKTGITGCLGKHRTQETKNKISKSRRGIEPYNKGKIQVKRGNKSRYINKNEKIPYGWKRAGTSKGRICITNGIKNKYIKKGESIPKNFYKGSKLSSYIWIYKGNKESRISKNGKIPKGWTKGSIRKGKIYINNGKKEKIIHKTDKIPKGFKKGRISFMYITNGKENKKVDKSIKIPKGWKQGLTQHINK